MIRCQIPDLSRSAVAKISSQGHWGKAHVIVVEAEFEAEVCDRVVDPFEIEALIVGLTVVVVVVEVAAATLLTMVVAVVVVELAPPPSPPLFLLLDDAFLGDLPVGGRRDP